MANTNAGLRKARMVQDYMRDGLSKAAARTKAGVGGSTSKPRASYSETVVPDDSGMGVTTRSGAHLTARFGAHVQVQFDGPALAAVLEGLFTRLLYGRNQNLALLYPSLYPEQAEAARQSRQYAQERQIGEELVDYLPSALQAFGISPEQWGVWYAQAAANAPPLPQAMQPRGQLAGGGPTSNGQPGAFASPLPGQLTVTGPFAAQR